VHLATCGIQLTLAAADNSLYIGTSAGEILHLFSIPPEPGDDSASPTFILASRLQPSGHAASADPHNAPGVQQILVLPGPSKACVLCNGVVSFYSLPEFSPAFPNREPTGVQWIGGIDENADKENPDGAVVMIANARRIMLVRVGERLKPIRNNIEYPGCLRSSRRDTIACVADDTGYALLEVEHQQKIPLFPISSLPVEEEPVRETDTRSPARSPPPTDGAGHGRSTSMGNLLSPSKESSQAHSSDSSHLTPPEAAGAGGSRTASPVPEGGSTTYARPKTRPRASTEALPTKSSSLTDSRQAKKRLQPHILSPFSAEFMLTTGTTESEPGVGLFVNLDGDVVRGTIDFESYPEDILIDNFSVPESEGAPRPDDEGKIICALLRNIREDAIQRKLEMQQVENASELSHPRTVVKLPRSSLETAGAGLRHTLSTHNHFFSIAGELLQLVPLSLDSVNHRQGSDRESDPRTQSAVEQLEQERALFDSQSLTLPAEPSREVMNKRAAEEKAFAGRFGRVYTRNIVWHGQELFMILQNPLISQLEHRLMQHMVDDEPSDVRPGHIFGFLAGIHNREPKDETEFLTLNYIRQKASLILFLHLQTQLSGSSHLEDLFRAVENTLHDGGLDPRVVLLLSCPLSSEVLYGPEGIWLHQGMVDLLQTFKSPITGFESAPIEFWMMMRHFLMLWQEKRGYGSITDDKYVFDSVDAALLHILLHLDQALPHDSPAQKSVRVKLNNVVDNWKGDFDRATSLLERYHRLYVLSRLYQSKKQARDVLATWKRIIDGEKDVDYSSNIGYVEGQLRRYLTIIRDVDLVQDYALWLAQRNAELAVQVFTDDSARVKFSPQEVVHLLKEHAPGAVQQYLEYLVFGKHLDQYADDLIGYYLDSVLTVLESSEAARTSLAESYSTYRALESPKPTYLDFIHQNAPPEPWWQSRLRLLQLLGSGAYATGFTTAPSKDLTYSVDMVLERLAPYSSFLVSESIILDARQGRHKEALRLLTHGLGDYDTATRYCYFGGPSAQSYPVDPASLPSRAAQTELFAFLFREFLAIQDVDDRLDRTARLLGKFATFFDPLDVLAEIPDDWSVGMLGEFLLRSFRAASSERNMAVVVKALSAAQNLLGQVEFIDVCEKIGVKVEKEEGDVRDVDVGER
jgi:vacuolar protein sorting-associated protein 3